MSIRVLQRQLRRGGRLFQTSHNLFKPKSLFYHSKFQPSKKSLNPVDATLKEKDSKKNSNFSIALPLILGSGLLYVCSTYLTTTTKKKLSKDEEIGLDQNQFNESKGEELSSELVDPSEKYSQLARSYDKSIDLDEKLMFLGYLRNKLLVNQVKGDVLELSCGTGRNFNSYLKTDISTINSLTCIDKSTEMVQACLQKEETKKTIEKFKAQAKSLKFIKRDCHSLSNDLDYLPLLKQYDTIVQTFGLCSYSNPKLVLNQMAEKLKPEGRILLLEHGTASYAWLNRILDFNSEKHAEKWGCVWNRDILKLVEDTDRFQVELCKRYHFGTTYMLVLKLKEVMDNSKGSK